MELIVKIEIDDNVRCCGRNCPFLKGDECTLFNEELEETELPEGIVWQDGVTPTRQRYYKCASFG